MQCDTHMWPAEIERPSTNVVLAEKNGVIAGHVAKVANVAGLPVVKLLHDKLEKRLRVQKCVNSATRYNVENMALGHTSRWSGFISEDWSRCVQSYDFVLGVPL